MASQKPAKLPISEEALRKLKAEYPDADLFELEHDTGYVVVRTPTEGEATRCIDELENDGKAVAMRNICTSCVVWPAADGYKALLNRQPFLFLSIGNSITEAFGLRKVENRKKL